jgi:ribose 5-phosphate isomerase RpiB
MIEIWLRTEFEGGRHARRVEKIRDIERRCASLPGDRPAGA